MPRNDEGARSDVADRKAQNHITYILPVCHRSTVRRISRRQNGPAEPLASVKRIGNFDTEPGRRERDEFSYDNHGPCQCMLWSISKESKLHPGMFPSIETSQYD